jgi:hypothetical protein
MNSTYTNLIFVTVHAFKFKNLTIKLNGIICGSKSNTTAISVVAHLILIEDSVGVLIDGIVVFDLIGVIRKEYAKAFEVGGKVGLGLDIEVLPEFHDFLVAAPLVAFLCLLV